MNKRNTQVQQTRHSRNIRTLITARALRMMTNRRPTRKVTSSIRTLMTNLTTSFLRRQFRSPNGTQGIIKRQKMIRHSRPTRTTPIRNTARRHRSNIVIGSPISRSSQNTHNLRITSSRPTLSKKRSIRIIPFLYIPMFILSRSRQVRHRINNRPNNFLNSTTRTHQIRRQPFNQIPNHPNFIGATPRHTLLILINKFKRE